MSEKSIAIVVWCGLTRHHAESARDLPVTTKTIVENVRWRAYEIEDLILEPIIAEGSFLGFGVILERMRTPLTPHQVRTRCDLPRIYKEEMQAVRALFRGLGFKRAANLYVTVVDE